MGGNMKCPMCNSMMSILDKIWTCNKCGMYLCPKCSKGLEWGKKTVDNKTIYFWRCTWCNYTGDDIIEI